MKFTSALIHYVEETNAATFCQIILKVDLMNVDAQHYLMGGIYLIDQDLQGELLRTGPIFKD